MFKEYLAGLNFVYKDTIAKYFELKKHLPSQEIIKRKENGNLILSLRLTQELEAEALIKKWLPHIKVIEPESLKEKIETELKEYLGL